MDSQQNLTLDTINSERFKNFYSIYEPQHIANTILTAREYIYDSRGTICRFCGKGIGQTKFKKEAHVIPQAIGNRYLLSKFECDTCNTFFGEKYENSFGNFMSVSKVFARVRNFNSKSKSAKHKEPKRGLEIEAAVSGYNVTFSHLDDQAFTIDKEGKTATLNAIIPTYVPLYVFKTFVKIGLCLINEGELNDFAKSFRFLIDTSQDKKLDGMPFVSVSIHSIPGIQLFGQPTAILYSRKHEMEREKVPQKILIVYFANRIYQIFLPFNSADAHLVGQQIRFPTFPILIDNTYFERFGMYTTRSFNLSSAEPKIGQKLKQTFSFGELQTF